jgi:2'-5' RNA ligase
MSGQSSFPGFEEAKPTDRLFLALFPPAETALHIAGLARQLRSEHALRGKSLEAARFHITLNHLGDYTGVPPDVVRQALGTALKKAGLGQWAKTSYTPHVTLLYDDQLLLPVALAEVNWRVTELVLVRSLLGETQHVHLQRWPLAGPSSAQP